MKTLLLAVFLSASVPNCGGGDPKSPGVVEKDDAKDCPAACANARSLECQEGNDLEYMDECEDDSYCTDGTICIKDENENVGHCGETCEMVCEAFVAQGVHQGLQCWANIDECSDIESECR